MLFDSPLRHSSSAAHDEVCIRSALHRLAPVKQPRTFGTHPLLALAAHHPPAIVAHHRPPSSRTILRVAKRQADYGAGRSPVSVPIGLILNRL